MFHNKLNAFSYKVFILIPLISMPKLPLDPESTLGIIIVALGTSGKQCRGTQLVYSFIYFKIKFLSKFNLPIYSILS